MASQASSVLRPLSKVVAVVTGGASGLGKATVETLARGGARVAILDLPQSKGAEVAKSLGPNAIFTPANVRDPSCPVNKLRLSITCLCFIFPADSSLTLLSGCE